jgi:cation-transporting ATPase E
MASTAVAPPATPARDVLDLARWTTAGLTSAQVAERAAAGEVNVVPPVTSRSHRRIVFENTVSFINVLLYAIVVLLLILGLYGDALMTAALVVANAVVGVVQEVRAKRELDRIALLARPTATVIRDAREQAIDPASIVLDDLLVVRPGDQLQVDGIVVTDGDLRIDESLLTGESDLVAKNVGDPVLSGSFCMTGSGSYRAERVGASSFAQQLTGQARAYRNVKTPLQREIGLVMRVMVVLVILLGAEVVDAFRQLYEDVPLTESVRAAAVIVALVPQGLIFMVTVTYTIAALRLSGKGALIQRMNAVESTSQIDVLCVDKTGTLTTNRLALSGLQPLGDVCHDDLSELLGAYAASTTAGNRTSAALHEGFHRQARPLAGEVPFSSARKWSALALQDDPALYVLGAPEMLRPALAPVDGLEVIDEWTARGLRVLLFARYPQAPVLGEEPRLVPGLVPLGLACLSDELRPEARETIAGFREAGIALKIISGDNPDTVAALARQAGLAGEITTVAGAELEELDEAGLREVVERTTVFGRVTPPQKEALVRALQANGHYVAMTGDGVNDVLALKQANLAIAMRSGSQVTRAVADIVLLQDSFAVLPKAFLEGQRILKGMQDIIRLFLVRTLYIALIILGASLLALEFPVTPKQSALLALLTVGVPTLFLAAWARPGTTPRRLIPSSSHFILPAALTIAAVGLTVYVFFLRVTDDVALARTALTITTVICGLAVIPFSEPPNEAWVGGDELSGDVKPSVLAGATLVVFIVLLYVPTAREFYELEPLPFSAYPVIALVVTGWATALRALWRWRPVERAWARLRARLQAAIDHRWPANQPRQPPWRAFRRWWKARRRRSTPASG